MQVNVALLRVVLPWICLIGERSTNIQGPKIDLTKRAIVLTTMYNLETKEGALLEVNSIGEWTKIVRRELARDTRTIDNDVAMNIVKDFIPAFNDAIIIGSELLDLESEHQTIIAGLHCECGQLAS